MKGVKAMLEVKNLTKKYGDYVVLNNINLKFNTNEIIGFLAPNGEGKTTFMKILGGLITKYSGEVLLNGEKINYKSRNKIAYMTDRNIIPESWSIEEALAYYNKYFKDYQREKTLDVLKRFRLNTFSKIGTLSLGNKEKVSLALTLGINAEVYMLDEPLASVDVLAREDILKTIVTEFSENSTMLISTHLIQDIEKIFDRVILLDRGSIVENRLVDEIRESGKSVVDFYKAVYRYENNI